MLEVLDTVGVVQETEEFVYSGETTSGRVKYLKEYSSGRGNRRFESDRRI